jgi:hypothetical protein
MNFSPANYISHGISCRLSKLRAQTEAIRDVRKPLSKA